jgi:hypothetical protein
MPASTGARFARSAVSNQSALLSRPILRSRPCLRRPFRMACRSWARETTPSTNPHHIIGSLWANPIAAVAPAGHRQARAFPIGSTRHPAASSLGGFPTRAEVDPSPNPAPRPASKNLNQSRSSFDGGRIHACDPFPTSRDVTVEVGFARFLDVPSASPKPTFAFMDVSALATGHRVKACWNIRKLVLQFSAAAPPPLFRASAGSRADLLTRPQGEQKRSVRPGIARGPQRPAIILDDRPADRQSHAHSPVTTWLGSRSCGASQPAAFPMK